MTGDLPERIVRERAHIQLPELPGAGAAPDLPIRDAVFVPDDPLGIPWIHVVLACLLGISLGLVAILLMVLSLVLMEPR